MGIWIYGGSGIVQGKTGQSLVAIRIFLDEYISKKLIIVVACPDQGAVNDPEPLRLAFHQGPTFINAYFPYCATWG